MTAADDYFTWMDAEGRIHNSPRPPAAAPAQKADEPVSSAPHQPDSDSASNSSEQYPDEAEVQKKIAQEQKENPPFYTWVDGEGRIRNSVIPQVSDEAKEIAVIQTFDATFIPPLRLNEQVRTSGCCAGYKPYFVRAEDALRSYSMTGFREAPLFQTSRGEKPAWYWVLGTANSGQRYLQIRLRGTTGKVALIALDKDYLPLYFEQDLSLQSHEETWAAEAYREALISIGDTEVKSFILYFQQGAGEKPAIEVQWWL